MPVKCTGAQFKAFYNDDAIWPEDSWHEDGTVLVNGAMVDDAFDLGSVADNDLISVADGIVLGVSDKIDPTLEGYLRKWLEAKATVSMAVEIERTNEEALRAAIKAAGGRILK